MIYSLLIDSLIYSWLRISKQSESLIVINKSDNNFAIFQIIFFEKDFNIC